MENSIMLQSIIKDSSTIKDYLVPIDKLIVLSGNDNQVAKSVPAIYFNKNSSENGYEYIEIHNNANVQISQKLNIPSTYLGRIHSGNDWERELYAHTLNSHFQHSSRGNVLLRSNDTHLKAFLSDRYERYNSIEVFSLFTEKMVQNGFKIDKAIYNGISYYIEFADKNNIVMIGDQPHWFGVQYRNSDFGQSALDIKLMLIKQICTNGVTTNSIMRSVHKGKSLGLDDGSFQLSQKTLNLAAEYKKSIIEDVVPQIVSREAREQMTINFNKVNELSIPVDKVIKELPSVVTKSDVEKINAVLIENNPDSGVNNCGNVLRVANAISYLANGLNNEDAVTIANYKDIAGKVITKYISNN